MRTRLYAYMLTCLHVYLGLHVCCQREALDFDPRCSTTDSFRLTGLTSYLDIYPAYSADVMLIVKWLFELFSVFKDPSVRCNIWHHAQTGHTVLLVMSLERRLRDRLSHCNELPISPTWVADHVSHIFRASFPQSACTLTEVSQQRWRAVDWTSVSTRDSCGTVSVCGISSAPKMSGGL